MSGRADPFGPLEDFQPASKEKPLPAEVATISKVADDNGFHSRQAQKPKGKEKPAVQVQKRYTTGRNVQRNIKAKQETYDLLDELQAEIQKREGRPVPFGEILDKALAVFAKSVRKGS